MELIQDMMKRKSFEADLRKNGCYEVSSGTLRAQDLLPKFLDLADVVAPGRRINLRADEHALEDESHSWWDSDDCASLLNEELPDLLNEHAPEGFCFGSHEGDGACFGFWSFQDDE
jgi:hypothetical protein